MGLHGFKGVYKCFHRYTGVYIKYPGVNMGIQGYTGAYKE